MEIAGEDIIEKIETKLSDGKGVIDEVSVGIEPVTTDEGVKYKCALYHVAIVTHGFYKGMDSFERLAASIKKSNKDAKFLILHAQDFSARPDTKCEGHSSMINCRLVLIIGITGFQKHTMIT